MRSASKTYSEVIPPEKIPDTIDLSLVKLKYEKHSYHPGAWPIDEPQPTRLPPVMETSHVVRDVSFNEDGGLSVSFQFLTTQRGSELMKKFDNQTFKLVPVMDEEGINILRFDFITEE